MGSGTSQPAMRSSSPSAAQKKYHTNPRGKVAACQSACASRTFHIGGKSKTSNNAAERNHSWTKMDHLAAECPAALRLVHCKTMYATHPTVARKTRMKHHCRDALREEDCQEGEKAQRGCGAEALPGPPQQPLHFRTDQKQPVTKEQEGGNQIVGGRESYLLGVVAGGGQPGIHRGDRIAHHPATHGVAMPCEEENLHKVEQVREEVEQGEEGGGGLFQAEVSPAGPVAEVLERTEAHQLAIVRDLLHAVILAPLRTTPFDPSQVERHGVKTTTTTITTTNTAAAARRRVLAMLPLTEKGAAGIVLVEISCTTFHSNEQEEA
eukprot:scaffold931_cov200-Ochromonas_danica.AAC.1